ncbi:MAG TPA: class I SAM-dependent methyltransferase [Actinophytocola sp.]|uniref:SAM-dependent methyltransferase n=1 Tax=Actinophytocola sp. TaxID=1872138 RepID=UPI002DBF5CE4|nr:class I SAM-dependent methyltransferase [Actinophytocola sp.]HEU5473548.1 class I SAM-dependent methyltransferase [Actinophytocola sp.]
MGTDAVGELYEWVTDLMIHTMDGELHGGYWAGRNPPETMAEAAERLTDLVAARCRLEPGQHLLDVGCGNGKATLRVAEAHRVRISAITISEYQLRLARTLAAPVAAAVDFHLADMRELPFPDATFDAALAIESISHISDRTQAYAEIRRVLRPGGVIAVTDFCLRKSIADPESAAWLETNSANWENGPILPCADYAAAVRAAGLELLEFTDIGDAVKPSFPLVADRMRDARDSVGDRLTDREFSGMVDAMERFGTLPELGYALVVARRPF